MKEFKAEDWAEMIDSAAKLHEVALRLEQAMSLKLNAPGHIARVFINGKGNRLDVTVDDKLVLSVDLLGEIYINDKSEHLTPKFASAGNLEKAISTARNGANATGQIFRVVLHKKDMDYRSFPAARNYNLETYIHLLEVFPQTSPEEYEGAEKFE